MLNLLVSGLLAVLGPGICRTTETGAPEFYEIPLVPTQRVPGTQRSSGLASVRFARSPFGITLTEEGDYVRDLELSVKNLRPAGRGAYVVWVTTPSLDRIERLGVLPDEGTFLGQVAWNKFLLVITLETDDASRQARWQGPVVLRGMSRSGAMHTSLGHGPFVVENCSAVGFVG